MVSLRTLDSLPIPRTSVAASQNMQRRPAFLGRLPFELALQVTSYLRLVDLAAFVRTSRHEFDCLQDKLYDLAVTHTCRVGTLQMTVLQWATLNMHYRKGTSAAGLQKGVGIQLRGSLDAKLLDGKHGMGREGDVRASHCNDQDLAQDMLSRETGGTSVRDDVLETRRRGTALRL